ncbi:MAG: DNA gyrase inhibitor YacG [Planctomycetota bacterium]
MTCSVCGRVFLLDETNSPPFCSERCKMIDLNRWFGEEIGLPHEGGPSKGEAIDPDTAEPDRLS